MNRPTNRLFAASAGLAACALSLTGCSSGQLSQTADQESAVNGTTATVKNIALRNVHIQAVQTSDYLQPGRSVELIFVAVNTSPDTNDRLVGISSDVGSADEGRRDAESADHQRPDLQLHLRLREGRSGEGRSADLRRRGTAAGRRARSARIGPHRSRVAARRAVLSSTPDNLTAWPKHVRSTAARNAATSAPNGWAAARSAAPGEPSTRWPR